jgi:methylenetetrahydrofolate dehydrogenase (NADP+)/methenyltetrahydrofolate cyclohydrolase
MQLLDGKKISAELKEALKSKVLKMRAEGKRPPHLLAILVGKDGASETYVASKARSCEEVGFNSSLQRFEDTVTEKELLESIIAANNDPLVDGIIVQLPLPKHISPQKVTDAISPLKDVDGFHPVNIGRMTKNQPAFIPATPLGIMLLLEKYHIDTKGMHCVVIGRSDIVGRPMSILMSRNGNPGNCTVTLCHSHTKNLGDFTRSADIIIAALGIPEFLKEDMVKQGAIVIDVGITRVDNTESKKGYVLKGDVDFETVAPKCSYITPVPGGVGLMTIAGLLHNTLIASQNN